jgi:hypothetical protein
MLAISNESREIAGAFSRYATSGDKNLIKDVPKGKIEIALMQYIAVAGKEYPLYKAMELRLNELNEEDKAKRTQKEKWKDRVIGAVFGLIGGLILAYVKNRLKL